MFTPVFLKELLLFEAASVLDLYKLFSLLAPRGDFIKSSIAFSTESSYCFTSKDKSYHTHIHTVTKLNARGYTERRPKISCGTGCIAIEVDAKKCNKLLTLASPLKLFFISV